MSTRCYVNIEKEGHKVETHTHCMTILESSLHQELFIHLYIHPNNLVLHFLKNGLTKLKVAGSVTADIYKKQLCWTISIAKWSHGNLMGGIMRPLTPSTQHTTVIYAIFISSEPGKICKLKTEKHITV